MRTLPISLSLTLSRSLDRVKNKSLPRRTTYVSLSFGLCVWCFCSTHTDLPLLLLSLSTSFSRWCFASSHTYVWRMGGHQLASYYDTLLCNSDQSVHWLLAWWYWWGRGEERREREAAQQVIVTHRNERAEPYAWRRESFFLLDVSFRSFSSVTSNLCCLLRDGSQFSSSALFGEWGAWAKKRKNVKIATIGRARTKIIDGWATERMVRAWAPKQDVISGHLHYRREPLSLGKEEHGGIELFLWDFQLEFKYLFYKLKNLALKV